MMTCRHKRPRHWVILGTLERYPVIHLQTVTHVPRISCMGDFSHIYCNLYPVARCDFDIPSTDLVARVVIRVVGAANEAAVVKPVKVAKGFVHRIRSATSFENKDVGVHDGSCKEVKILTIPRSTSFRKQTCRVISLHLMSQTASQTTTSCGRSSRPTLQGWVGEE